MVQCSLTLIILCKNHLALIKIAKILYYKLFILEIYLSSLITNVFQNSRYNHCEKDFSFKLKNLFTITK